MPTKYKLVELSELDQDLILLRDEVYGGNWDRFSADLVKRQSDRPYYYKTQNRIKNDLTRIYFLRKRLGE